MPDIIQTLQFMLRDPAYWDQMVWPGRPVQQGWYQSPEPPATPAQVAAAEARLGSPLPPLLKRIYLEVANGGIGPDYYALFRITDLRGDTQDDRTLQELWPGFYGYIVRPADPIPEEAGKDYELSTEERDWIWPPGLVYVSDGGCSYNYYYYALDPDFPVMMSEEPVFLPEKPITFKDNLEMLNYFGGVIAHSFDAWVGDWVEAFQRKWKRDYVDTQVQSELYPEPRYLLRRQREVVPSELEAVPASQWRPSQ